MTISEIKKQIKDNKLSNYYVFAGEEIEIQKLYIEKIAEVTGNKIVRAESVSSVWELMTGPSLFDEHFIYVVRDDKDFQSNETLQSRLSEDIFNGNILIILLTTLDKRTKFYKQFSAQIVTFERMSTSVLMKYVKQDTALNTANCERIIGICENDYSRIKLEIDKIRCYGGEPNETFEELVNQGVIYQPPMDAIFKLVDAILLRQPKRVYNLLRQCYAVGEANIVILSVLYNNTKQVLQVQSYTGSDIVKSTGMTAWQVKCAKERMGHYSVGELVYILRQIQRIQKGILIGQIEDSMSVEYLLAQIL